MAMDQCNKLFALGLVTDSTQGPADLETVQQCKTPGSLQNETAVSTFIGPDIGVSSNLTILRKIVAERSISREQF